MKKRCVLDLFLQVYVLDLLLVEDLSFPYRRETY